MKWTREINLCLQFMYKYKCILGVFYYESSFNSALAKWVTLVCLVVGGNTQRISVHDDHDNYTSVHSICWERASLDKGLRKLYKSI